MIAFSIHWDPDPSVIPAWDLPRWYSMMWLLGVVLGYQLIRHIYKKEGMDENELQKLAVTIMVFAVLGARLGHVFFYDWAYYSEHLIEILPIKLEPSFQFTGFAGLASHGGVLGALLGLWYYNRKRKFNYGWLLDRLTIGGAMLGCFIRLGNLMNSEIIGKPSEVAWAFIFARVDNVPRHPAQLYEAIFYLLISLLLFRIWQRQQHRLRHGFICGLGLTLIFLQRFFVEFLKENQVAFENELTLNMGQLLSIPIVILGLVIMWYTRKKPVEPLTAD